MEPQHEQTSSKQPQPADDSHTEKKRFRVEKLEERIAPAAHCNPQSKQVGGGHYDTSASGSDAYGSACVY